MKLTHTQKKQLSYVMADKYEEEIIAEVKKGRTRVQLYELFYPWLSQRALTALLHQNNIQLCAVGGRPKRKPGEKKGRRRQEKKFPGRNLAREQRQTERNMDRATANQNWMFADE